MSRITLTALDSMDSPLWAGSQDSTQNFSYGPYGSTPARDARHGLLPGFNGQRLDPVSQSYHLGNGYRAYNPVLMRFNVPDSWSPFGAGGLNPYAYCAGDPINRSDPSGHISAQAGVGIGLGILGLLGAVFSFGSSLAAAAAAEATLTASMAVDLITGAAGVAASATGIASAATKQSDPEASKILGWVSFGLGVGSLVLSGLSSASRVTQRLRQRLGPVVTEGLSGRGAAAAGRSMASQALDASADEPIFSVYRVDSRSPQEIRRAGGFGRKRRADSDNCFTSQLLNKHGLWQYVGDKDYIATFHFDSTEPRTAFIVAQDGISWEEAASEVARFKAPQSVEDLPWEDGGGHYYRIDAMGLTGFYLHSLSDEVLDEGGAGMYIFGAYEYAIFDNIPARRVTHWDFETRQWRRLASYA